MLVLANGKTAAFGPRDEILRKVLMRPSGQGNVEPIQAASRLERV
jgi:ABC-type protease/lipase transport system fused ATPase/permease subunit